MCLNFWLWYAIDYAANYVLVNTWKTKKTRLPVIVTIIASNLEQKENSI